MNKTSRIALMGLFALLVQVQVCVAKADTWANMGEGITTQANTDPGGHTTVSDSSSFYLMAGSSSVGENQLASATVTHSWQYQSAPGVQSANTATLVTSMTLDYYVYM